MSNEDIILPREEFSKTNLQSPQRSNILSSNGLAVTSKRNSRFRVYLLKMVNKFVISALLNFKCFTFTYVSGFVSGFERMIYAESINFFQTRQYYG